MNDTQPTARQRGGNSGNNGPNQNYGAQRQGSFEGNPGGNGYNNNMNQYNGPPPNNYDSYGGNQGAQNYPMNHQMGGGGMKRKNFETKSVFDRQVILSSGPASISFTMKIRGVPFEAGEKEVFEVRLLIDI